MPAIVDDYFKAINKIPLLTATEEIHLGRLIRRWQDHDGGPDLAPAFIQCKGRKALNRFVTGNLRLVINLAAKNRLRAKQAGLEFEDLLSEGNIGLTRAAVKFDPELGYKFSTYAHWWIRQAISRGIETGDIIRFSVHVRQQINRFKRQKSITPNASFDEIAIAVGLTPEIARKALSLDHLQNVASYDAPTLAAIDGPSALLDMLESKQRDELEAIQYQDLFDTIRLDLAGELALVELKQENNNTQDISRLLGVTRQETGTMLINSKSRLKAALEFNGVRELLAA